MIRLIKIIFIMSGLALSVLTLPEAAFAAPDTCMNPNDAQAYNNPADINNIQKVFECCNKLNGVFFMLNDCTRTMLNTAITTRIAGMVNYLSNFVSILMMFAIMAFGMKIATGAIPNNAKAHTISLIAKMALVSSLILSLEIRNFIPMITSTADDIASVFIESQMPGENVWKKVDEVFFGFFGYVNTIPNNIDVSKTGLALIGIIIVGGPVSVLGIMLFLGALGSVAVAFAIGVYTGFVALFALAFLAATAPLFFPFFIFENRVLRGLFEQWKSQILFYSLQLIVVTLFISFMVTIMGNLLGVAVNPVRPGSLVGMISSLNDQTCHFLRSAWFTGIEYPCPDWDRDDVMDFVTQVAVIFVSGVAMVGFMFGLPTFTNRLTGGPSVQNIPGEAAAMFGHTGKWSYDMGKKGAQGVSRFLRSNTKNMVTRTFKTFTGSRSGIGGTVHK